MPYIAYCKHCLSVGKITLTMIYGLKYIFIRNTSLSDLVSMYQLFQSTGVALDKELAQDFLNMWDVMEQSPFFWAAVIRELAPTTVHILRMSELSAPKVKSYIGLGGMFPSSFKWADATSTEWEGQWPREIDSKVTSDTSNLDYLYKLFRAHCWLLLLTLAVSYTNTFSIVIALFSFATHWCFMTFVPMIL